MKARTPEAARLEADYLARVKAAIAGREPSEIDEIIGSLRDHIEEELSEADDDRVSLVQMANVLEQLGPPEAYSQEEGTAPKTAPVSGSQREAGGQRLSKLAIAAMLCVPAGVLIGALFVAWASAEHNDNTIAAAGALSSVVVSITGVVLGIAALSSIRNQPHQLRGKGFAWFGLVASAAIVLLWFLWFASASHSEEPAPAVPVLQAPRPLPQTRMNLVPAK